MSNRRGICAMLRREFETLWLSQSIGEMGKCLLLWARQPAWLLTPVLMAVCGWGGIGYSAAQGVTSPTDHLVKAMQENNVRAAEEALKQGASPNVPVDGTPLPFVAAWRGRTEILKALLDHGVRPDICSEVDHTSLLIYATHMGDPAIIRMLLDHKVPVNVRNHMGETALTVVRNPDPPQPRTRAVVMRMLLHAGADPEIHGEMGLTAIMRYAHYGISDAVEVLAEAGAKVNARDYNGNTALIAAAGWGTGDTGGPDPERILAILRCLLKHGADLQARNHDGLTALMAAKQAQHPEIVSLLRERGAVDPNETLGPLPLDPELLQQALETAQDLPDPADSTLTLMRIAEAQLQAGERERALQTLHIAKQKAQKIDVGYLAYDAVKYDSQSSILESLAELQARAGESVEARRMIASLKESPAFEFGDARDPLRCAIASGQAQTGDVAGARQTLDELEYHPREIPVMLAIAETQTRAGDKVGALQTLRDARQKTEQRKYWDEDEIWTLLSITQAQTKVGDTTGAKETLSIIAQIVPHTLSKANRVSDRALHDIAVMQAQTHEMPAAEQTADLIQDADCKTWALVRVAEEQGKAGERASARRTLTRALRTAAQIPVVDDRGVILADIVRVQVQIGEIPGARQTTKTIRKVQEREQALLAVAAGQAATRDLAGARQTTAEIRNAGTKVRALTEIAAAQNKIGERIDARRTLHSAAQTAEGIGNPIEKERALLAIAETQSRDRTEARQTIRRARQAVHRIGDADDKSAALQAIAEAQTQQGDRADALQTVREISGPRERVFALLSLAPAWK